MFLENTDRRRSVTVGSQVIFYYGREIGSDSTRSYYPAEDERGPIYTNEWDMFSVNSDTQTQFSFESGPEIQLTAVTEQQLDDAYTDKYKDMSMMGVGVFAGRDTRSSQHFSVGDQRQTLPDYENTSSSTSSSSYAPDIFVDTLLDDQNGIGEYVEVSNIDTDSLALAKAFAKATICLVAFDEHGWFDCRCRFVGNGLPTHRSACWNLRERTIEKALPALPVNSSGKLLKTQVFQLVKFLRCLRLAILEGSYKEEFLNYGAATEDLIASVIYESTQAGDF